MAGFVDDLRPGPLAEDNAREANMTETHLADFVGALPDYMQDLTA
jgi:hypothetical protein